MLEIMQKRHSVRQYYTKSIEVEKRQVLSDLIAKANAAADLNIQACYDEPEAFDTFMAHYGKFEGVTNYIVLVAGKNKDELIGYWGEHIVLKAQELGLNTCWVALTYGKSKTKITKKKGEKIYCTLALGYGKTQGADHKTKSLDQVCNRSPLTPSWFIHGVKVSLLAPTAMNQQKFKFFYNEDGTVDAKAGFGMYTKIDLGIAKCHFELGASPHEISFFPAEPREE